VTLSRRVPRRVSIKGDYVRSPTGFGTCGNSRIYVGFRLSMRRRNGAENVVA